MAVQITQKKVNDKTVKHPLSVGRNPETPSASADGLEGRKLGLHDAPGEGRVCDV